MWNVEVRMRKLKVDLLEVVLQCRLPNPDCMECGMQKLECRIQNGKCDKTSFER